ncbi:MAG: exodeoxyribonuclease VII large subunit [Bacteroidetes bacterium]|nr:MAG: exodeoxyribonuclease VII large subunit [Bacteroidota bacterium]
MKEDSPVFSVQALTLYLKELIEGDTTLQHVNVGGEVSNLTYHGSGHVYFTLKDSEAQLTCVMFRSYALLSPRIAAGERIVVVGDMSIYAPRGNYQLMVRQIRKEGLGDLYQRFLALKDKLQREGLFDETRKRAIPQFPQTIAVITSPTGAAVRDILQTLQRRYGRGRVIVIPAVVQGEQGPSSLIQALAAAPGTGAEVVILARGGGSIEDLWNFNEESVARAIAACPVPVISGIGHETDFTIADFVADFRASTPTAAAERATPDIEAIRATLNEWEKQMQRGLQYFIDFKRQVLDDYAYRLEQALRERLRDSRRKLDVLDAQLRGQDIRSLLQQGYTLTLKEGIIQRSHSGIVPGDRIETIFADGRIASVTEDPAENQTP